MGWTLLAQTIQFAYRGKAYAIDLSEREASAFDSAMAKYLDHAPGPMATELSVAASWRGCITF